MNSHQLSYLAFRRIDMDMSMVQSTLNNAHWINNAMKAWRLRIRSVAYFHTVETLYSTIGGVHEMRSCYRRIMVK